MFNNKRGQIFLMAAIILVMVLYTLTIKYNYASESVSLENYGELRDNYNTEVPKVMNRALFTYDPEKCKANPTAEGCPITEVKNFSSSFQQYASQKDPNFGLVSIVKDPVTGNIIINNLLAGGKYIQISPKGYNGTITLYSTTTNAPGSINLDIGGQAVGLTTGTSITSYGENFTRASVGQVKVLEIQLSDGSKYSIDVEDASTLTNSNTGSTIDYDVCPSSGGRC